MAVKQVFNTSAELDFPNVLPTLDLDFANSKTLDPRITFTRASGGSYVGADGLIKYAGVNEARFDHDPETGESLGLLIEESRTNLFIRSEEFNVWNQANVSVLLNSGSSPDGNFNAIQIVENATTSAYYVARDAGTITSGLPYTVSCFAKSTNPNRFFSLIFQTSSLFGGVFPRASFDLTSGKIHTITSATSAKIENYGNGWYRCSVTATPSVTGSSVTQLRLQNSTTVGSMLGFYTGDGVSGLYLWGAQAEQGAFPTSYIPTQASTRTRVGDIAFINLPPTGEWYNYSEGSLVFQHTNVPFSSATSAGFPAIGFAGENGSSINSIQYYFVKSTGLTQYLVRDLGVNQAVISVDLGAFASKIGFSYKTRSFVLIRNGRLVSRNNSGLVPQSVRTLILGTNVNNPVNNMNASISNLKYFPKALSPSNLQSLTS
jgi:hypothetical protein